MLGPLVLYRVGGEVHHTDVATVDQRTPLPYRDSSEGPARPRGRKRVRGDLRVPGHRRKSLGL